MRKLNILCSILIWLCMASIVVAQSPQSTTMKRFNVRGTLPSLKDSTVYIFYTNGSDTIVRQLKASKTGTINYSAQISEPTKVFINTKGPGVDPWSGEYYSEINCWVEPGRTTLISENKLTREIQANGNITQSMQNEFNKINVAVQQAQTNVRRKGENAKKEGTFAAIKPKLDAEWDSIDNSKRNYILNFIKKNPSSYVSLSLIRGYTYYFKWANRDNELANAFNLLSNNVTSSIAADRTREFLGLAGNLKIGTKVKDIISRDSSGNSVSISSLRGKYVLIDYWASWCVPCRAEIPKLKAIYDKHQKRNFTIMSISLDEKREQWIQALIKESMPWLNVSDLNGFDSTSAKFYNVKAIPFNILIDPSGTIVARNLSSRQLMEKLNSIL